MNITTDRLPLLDSKFRYDVEVRHESWFQDITHSFFANNNICLAWSQFANIMTPPIVTSDFTYLRLIGDRSIDEKDFGKIQKDRSEEMQDWANKWYNKQKKQQQKRIQKKVVDPIHYYHNDAIYYMNST